MKRLLLLGAGPAHLQLLQALVRAPLAGAEVLLVAPFALQFHAALLAGHVAGRHAADDCIIALPPLAAAAGVACVEATVTALDLQARRVMLSNGAVADYDLLSLDPDAVQDRDQIPGARTHALFLRPTEHFVRLQTGLRALAAQRVLDVVVIGRDVAGVELALALRQALAADRHNERARIALVTGGPLPLAGHGDALIARAAAALAQRRITVIRAACTAIDAQAVFLANGARLACDAAVVATASAAPAWLVGSGLALDAQGQVSTGPTLQSVSHANVFAVGAQAADAGAVLALNLQRHVGGGTLQHHRPRARRLRFIDCGDGTAIAGWRGGSAQGRWVGWWKDRIDRAGVQRDAVIPSA